MEQLPIHFPLREPTVEEFIDEYIDIEMEDTQDSFVDYEDGPRWETTL